VVSRPRNGGKSSLTSGNRGLAGGKWEDQLVQDITTAILTAAMHTRQRFQLSYWDSAIIEASRALGCAEVLSEDLGSGQDYAGVQVTNPFR